MIVIALASIATERVHAQSCGNVTNAGFENDLSGWTVSQDGTGTIVNDAHSGTKAIRLGTVPSGVNSAGFFQVTAGQQVNYEVWAKISGSPGWTGVGLDFLDANENEISEVSQQITSTSYQRYAMTPTVPSGATHARIWTYKTGTTGYLFLDDFCLLTPDTQAPTIPTGLSASAITSTSFTLSWSASTDNVGVTAYDVFRNGTLMTTVTEPSATLTELTASTIYAMRVQARDAAENTSSQSAALNVTTLAAETSCGSINNNGFENGLSGWTNDNGVNSTTTDAHTGTSAAVTGPARGGLHYGTAIPVSGGQTVTVTVYAKTSGNPVWSGFGLDYLDGAENEIDEAHEAITNSTTYQEFTLTGTVPAGTATVSLWTYKDGDTGNLFMDDFCLTISGTADTQAPTVPTGLTPSNITSSGFTLSWTASTDGTGGSGVTEYEIFRNNTSIGTSTETTFNVLNLAPATTYAMRVSARDAVGNLSAQSTALNVTTLSNSIPVGRVNNMGININGSGGLDYVGDKAWADAMRSHRWIARLNSFGDDALKDANYWPLEDCHILVWDGLNTNDNHGTYRLYFTGKAIVEVSDGTVNGLSYNAATNTSTANIVITDQDNGAFYLDFRNTQQTSTSATNTGIKNIKLMRPVAPGSSQSYPADRDFTDQFLTAISNFSTIRFMDFTATNSNGDEIWSDRTKWTDARQNPPPVPGRTYGWQERGASWESVIKMANAAGKDAWICIPHKVDENYITNLATLFRDGNEHTPGLNPNLKLYVEYSNEVWNPGSAFQQTSWTNERGSTYGHPLNYDGETNDFTLGQRYKAMMTVRISEIFRNTFGNDQMMSRIRPVLMWQKGWQDPTNRQLSFIDMFYNKRDPRSNHPTPHPVNYYIWGGGGSTYFNIEEDGPIPTIDEVWESGTFNVDEFYNLIANDAAYAKTFGLQYVSYEGNTHPRGDNSDVSLINQASLDPRMKDELKEHHYAFNQLDGDLLCYFNLTGLPFGLAADNIEDINTPKFQAIGELKNEAPQAVTYGSVPPFSRDGNATDVFAYYSVSPDDTGPLTLTAVDPNISDPNEANIFYHSGYTFHVNTSGNYTVQVEYHTNRSATLAVEFDGNVLQTFSLPNTNETAANTAAMTISCTADKLYGIRLVCTSGEVTIRLIKVNPAAGSSAAMARETPIDASPNPIRAGQSVEITGLDTQAPATLQVVDMSGTVKLTEKVEPGNTVHSINTSALQKGIYILKVKTNEGIINKRIVVE